MPRYDEYDDEDDRPARRVIRRRPAPRNDGPPVLLIVGIIVGLVVFVGGAVGVAYFVMNTQAGPGGGGGGIALIGGEQPQPQPPPPPLPLPLRPGPLRPPLGGIVPPPGVDPQNVVPPPSVAGKKTVDLVRLIDVTRDTNHGDWVVEGGALKCRSSHFVPRIQAPYRPPQEYDFLVTFSQPSLRNGVSLIMPNPKGGSFFWYIASGHGAEYGFHSEPSNLGGMLPGLIQPNRAYTTRVEVRRGRVRGMVDGKVLVDHATDYSDLKCDNWRQLKDKSVVAVGCDEPTVFHHVRVVEVTGTGSVLPGAEPRGP